MQPNGMPFIQGDGSHEEILEQAVIHRAKGLVSAVSSEAQKVFITMTAREMCPKLNIIARFEEESTEKSLLWAGANQVVNPYSIGSKKISQIPLKPGVTKILDYVSSRDGLNMDIQEFEVHATHKLLGESLSGSNLKNNFNVILLAIKKDNGDIHSAPKSNYEFCLGDLLVLIAAETEFKKLTAYYA